MRFPRPTRLDAGIFLISFAVLLIELLLTRIFSVTLYYHLSFMVVSLAMLGLGASGLVVNLWPRMSARSGFSARLAWGALLFAVAAVLVVGVAFRLPISLTPSKGNLLRLALIYVLCVIPFLLGGLVVALILTDRADDANRLYFFDLLGAATGCIAFIPLTNWLGAPTAVLVGAFTATLAALVFAGLDDGRDAEPHAGLDAEPERSDGRTLRRVALLLGGVLLLTAAANTRWSFYDVRTVKGRRQPPTLALKWNSFSRVEVEGTPEDLDARRAPVGRGLSYRLPAYYQTTELKLRYDAGALTQIARFDGDLEHFAYLRYDVASAPYQMRRYGNVLVLGAGGGRDILTALYMGNRRVTGVEINPLTVSLMRGALRDFTGGLYDGYAGVRIVNDEGRSFLRDERAQYDLIQASLVDTWAASTAGAYALTENNLYTVEAFDEYLRHLTPDGVVAFSRWFTAPPVESLRVVTLAAEALRRQHVADPAAHIFVLRTNNPGIASVLCTILVKRAPFTPAELDKLRAWANEMDFPIVYAPGDASATSDTAATDDTARAFATHNADAHPATSDATETVAKHSSQETAAKNSSQAASETDNADEASATNDSGETRATNGSNEAPATNNSNRAADADDFRRLLGAQSAQFIAGYPYDISAVYDDRPFFFDRTPLARWLAHRAGLARSRVGQGSMTLGGQSLLAALIISALCTLLLLVLPLAAARRGRGETFAAPALHLSMTRPRAMLWTLYFAALGLGFIAVEVVLIQRFNLFFGYPVYSLSIVLFTILLASGAGSYLSGRWRAPQTLACILALLCAVLLLYALALPRLLGLMLGVPLALRIPLAVLVLAPLGLLMGMPFPTGLRRAGGEAATLVSWAWAVNGVASVFGSTLTMLLSMTYGFDTSLLFGALAYLAALTLVSLTRLRSTPSDTAA